MKAENRKIALTLVSVFFIITMSFLSIAESLQTVYQEGSETNFDENLTNITTGSNTVLTGSGIDGQTIYTNSTGPDLAYYSTKNRYSNYLMRVQLVEGSWVDAYQVVAARSNNNTPSSHEESESSVKAGFYINNNAIEMRYLSSEGQFNFYFCIENNTWSNEIATQFNQTLPVWLEMWRNDTYYKLVMYNDSYSIECSVGLDSVNDTNNSDYIAIGRISNAEWRDYQNMGTKFFNLSYTNVKSVPAFSSSVTSMIYGTSSDYSASESNEGDSDCSYVLLRNGTEIDDGSSVEDGTILGAGVYNYTYYTEGCENYTAGSDENTLVVERASRTCTLETDMGWTRDYNGTASSTTCSVSAGEEDGEMAFIVNSEETTNPDLQSELGEYEYTCQWVEGSNYEDCEQQSNTLTISKGTPTCSLSSSNGWSYDYGEITTISCSCNGDGTTSLYLNGELANDYNYTEITFSADEGGRDLVCNITEGTNYNSASDSNSLSVSRITPSFSSSVTSMIYGTSSDYSASESNEGDSDCSYVLLRNGTEIDDGSSVEDGTILGAGVYNYTYYTEGCENYTAGNSQSTMSVNKADSTCPLSGISDHDYGYSDTVACSCTGAVTAHLYQNGTLRDEWNNTERFYDESVYAWACNGTNSNYTVEPSEETQTITLTDDTVGTYSNNSITTTAGVITTINATTDSTVITLDVTTDSDLTNSSIGVTEYNSTPGLATIGIYGLDKFFEINTDSELGSGLLWALINISYSDSEVSAAGIEESSLRVYFYNSTLGNWTSYDPPLGGVDASRNYVWANTTHFSIYSFAGLLSNGQSCNASSACSSGYCVHSVCRVSSAFCGDGYCDFGESGCLSDCPIVLNSGGGGGSWTLPTNKVENVTKEEPIKEICQEAWTCTNWSECIDSVQSRACTDVNSCGTSVQKPSESRTCTVPTTIEQQQPEVPIQTETTTPLSLGVGLIAVIAMLAIIYLVIFKKKKNSKRSS